MSLEAPVFEYIVMWRSPQGWHRYQGIHFSLEAAKYWLGIYKKPMYDNGLETAIFKVEYIKQGE
jgi:hypothetical protein